MAQEIKILSEAVEGLRKGEKVPGHKISAKADALNQLLQEYYNGNYRSVLDSALTKIEVKLRTGGYEVLPPSRTSKQFEKLMSLGADLNAAFTDCKPEKYHYLIRYAKILEGLKLHTEAVKCLERAYEVAYVAFNQKGSDSNFEMCQALLMMASLFKKNQ